jgi:hypothetical protein
MLRLRHHADRIKINERLLTLLSGGIDWKFLAESHPAPDFTPEGLAEAWRQISEPLVRAHVLVWPGTRPSGFWRFQVGMNVDEEWDEHSYPTQWHYLAAHQLLWPEDGEVPPPRQEQEDVPFPSLAQDRLLQLLEEL